LVKKYSKNSIIPDKENTFSGMMEQIVKQFQIVLFL